MGNRQSTPSTQTMHHMMGGPKTFYLISGGPPIRFIGHPPVAGPLIFNVETDQLDENEDVDRAETIQLPVAVPSRQSFRLTQFDPKSKESGFLLSFSISMSEPGQTLRVLAGVDIDYRVGEGIQLMQSERSQNPFCLLEFVSPEEFQEEIHVSEPVHLEKLRKAQFRQVENGARRLTYAPIAIVLFSEAPADDAIPMSPSFAGASASVPVFSRREHGESVKYGTSSATMAYPPMVQIVQYTFLDIPDGVRGRSSLPLFPQTDSSEEATRPVYEAKMVRQLLQHGTQVYELDDVYDLGGDYNSVDSNDEEADEVDLCVICLMNARNTTILPCRHMCLCYECASVLRFQQNNRCPVCRSNIERVMTI